MFTKILFVFAFFAISLVSAAPANDKQPELSYGAKTMQWFRNFHIHARSMFKEKTKNIEQTLNELYQKSKKYVEIREKHYSELEKKYLDLKNQAKADFAKQKQKWESQIAESEKNVHLEAGKEKYETLKLQAEEAYNHEKVKYEAKFAKLKQLVENTLDAGKLKIFENFNEKTFEEAMRDLQVNGHKDMQIPMDKYSELMEKFEAMKTQAKAAYQEYKKMYLEGYESGKATSEEWRKQSRASRVEIEHQIRAKYEEWKQMALKVIESTKQNNNDV